MNPTPEQQLARDIASVLVYQWEQHLKANGNKTLVTVGETIDLFAPHIERLLEPLRADLQAALAALAVKDAALLLAKTQLVIWSSEMKAVNEALALTPTAAKNVIEEQDATIAAQAQTIEGLREEVEHSTNIRTIDHPEANGRKAKVGEQAYTLSFTNEAGRVIAVEMGKSGFETTTNLLMDMLSNAEPHDDGSTTAHPYWKLIAMNESLAIRNKVLEHDIEHEFVAAWKKVQAVLPSPANNDDRSLCQRTVDEITTLRAQLAAANRELEGLREDSELARQMLFIAHCYPKGYYDDGELQDTREHPFIDFKRDPLKVIEQKLQERGLTAYKKQLDAAKTQGGKGT